MTDSQSSHREAAATAADPSDKAPEPSSPEDNFSDDPPETSAHESDYSNESPETSPSSEPSSARSNALATQGSHESATTPLSPLEPSSAADGRLNLTPFNEEPSPDAVWHWLPDERPRSTQAMGEELARITACLPGQGATEEARDKHAGTGQGSA